MSASEPFEAGEPAYRLHAGDITRVFITRTTATQAIVTGRNGYDERFNRQTGAAKSAGGAFAGRARLERPTPALDERFRVAQSRVLANQLSYAAQQFARGDDEQGARMTALFAEWSELQQGASS